MNARQVTPRPDPRYPALVKQAPYTVTLDGLTIEVHRDVFPPDLGHCAVNMARLARDYAADTALDMGCGTGFIALSLKRAGVRDVWASDIHGPAVANTLRNAQLNPQAGPITLVRSDLFDALPAAQRFDLVVFNQPFGPGREERRLGCGPDGGADICRRFLAAARTRLTPNGVVMMAFSDRQAPEHDPRLAALAARYDVTTLVDQHYNDARNFIYAMRPRSTVS